MKKFLRTILLVIILFSPVLVSENKNHDLIFEVIKKIKELYVDKDKLNDKRIIYGAIKGIVSTLDPHSQFLEPEDLKSINEEIKGEFGGLGIEVGIQKGKLTIISPIEDTPAFRAGLKPGDHISAIEGKSTEGITIIEAVRKLRGKPGTKVTISIEREGMDEPFDVTITREIIKIHPVKWYVIKDEIGDIGYVKITSFNENTSKDLEKVLSLLKEKEIKFLILDLRNNPGGLLSSAVDVASQFIPRGKIIVSTIGRLEEFTNIEYSKGGIFSEELIPLAVIVNIGSASASEIVTGAIKDYKRGIIVGSKTFGKGSVQRIYSLSDGSALKLTIAYYYTPNRNLIHEKGIEPDVVVEKKKEGKAFSILLKNEAFIDFAKSYVKTHPDVSKKFEVNDEIFNKFLKMVEKFNIPNSLLEEDKGIIKKQIKYEILKEAKGKNVAEEVILREDEEVNEAIKILKKNTKH
jgi:carboxyl-terminal processing protease